MRYNRFDEMTIVAVAFLVFIGLNLVRDMSGAANSAFASGGLKIWVSPESSEQTASDTIVEQDEDPARDDNAIGPPYAEYVVTQGLHGFDYGHAAIDLTSGKDAPIQSPINGEVTALYLDDLGNTVLVIENSRYQVILMHGIYSVTTGDTVHLGEVVGVESNQGNTVDALGVSCRGRDCGYHTHLNIFDKQRGSNVNPLELFQQ